MRLSLKTELNYFFTALFNHRKRYIYIFWEKRNILKNLSNCRWAMQKMSVFPSLTITETGKNGDLMFRTVNGVRSGKITAGKEMHGIMSIMISPEVMHIAGVKKASPVFVTTIRYYVSRPRSGTGMIL